MKIRQQAEMDNDDNHSTHNNKWNFLVVRASLNHSVRVTKSSIYYE